MATRIYKYLKYFLGIVLLILILDLGSAMLGAVLYPFEDNGSCQPAAAAFYDIRCK